MKTQECLEKESRVLWKVLPTAALIWALLWSPSEWLAQNVDSSTEGAKIEAVTAPTIKIDSATTVDLASVMEEMEEIWEEDQDSGPSIEPDPEEESEWAESLKDKKRAKVHGSIQGWSSVVPDYADVCSDKASMTVCLDVTDSETWLWITAIRMDDFHTDPEHPFSQASVLTWHWGKAFADGKISVWVAWQYLFVDRLPLADGFTGKVVGAYKMDGWWTFEGTYFHAFSEWPDVDAFRLWISKKISDALRITAQWRYKSDYDGLFGRIIVDVDMWHGLWAQMSCIAKDGKLTPTVWVMYTF